MSHKIAKPKPCSTDTESTVFLGEHMWCTDNVVWYAKKDDNIKTLTNYAKLFVPKIFITLCKFHVGMTYK